MEIEKINTREFNYVENYIDALIDKVNELIDAHNKSIQSSKVIVSIDDVSIASLESTITTLQCNSNK